MMEWNIQARFNSNITVMSAQTRRHLTNINQSLRSENVNLKQTKDHLVEHINGLIKRQKQLTKMKQQLTDELIRKDEEVKIQRKTKEPLCLFLKDQLSQLDKKHIQGNLRLRNLQHQYEVCLTDYEKVTNMVQGLIEGSSQVENEFGRLKEADTTMKAMIFDCERLKRVLEEERRYFRQLCSEEQKSHEERLKELKSIQKNIKEEEDSSTYSIRLSKLQIGLMKLGNFFNQRTSQYRESFVRGQVKEVRTVKMGVKSLQNCISIATAKQRQNQRALFTAWHHAIFPKSVLSTLSQRALQIDQQSRLRIKVLVDMSERVHQKTTDMLNLYQKVKYIASVANKCSRKDMHYGFSLWRNSAHKTRQAVTCMEKAFLKIIPQQLQRHYFKSWNQATVLAKRFQMASLLLQQFETNKQFARMFRKWRFEILRSQDRKVRQYIVRLQDHDMIKRRVNYEKRKMKVLTMLGLKIQRIKMRNYFTKYWCNVREMKANQTSDSVEKQREVYSQLRKEAQKEQKQIKAKDKNLLIHIFRDFVYRCRIVPVYKQWRNQSQHFKKEKRAIMSLVLRKEAKNKIYVMNQFRRVVQHYEKKEMHQVLTDLNHKMETINEKSTQFRESLKNCIDNLGAIASKKMDYVTKYVLDYQQRLFFNTYIANKISKTYKTFLTARMMSVFQLSCERQTFSSIQQHIKANQRFSDLNKKVDKFVADKLYSKKKTIFRWLKRQAVGHQQGFRQLIHIQNVFIFYRMAWAFAAVKREFTARKYQAMYKELEDKGNVLRQKEQNNANLQNAKGDAQQALKEFFGQFIEYEDRHQKIRQRQRAHTLLKKYLDRFRRTVQKDALMLGGAKNMADVFTNSHQYFFFRQLMVIRHEQLSTEIKEQLVKLNKKRKNFEDKNGKARNDMVLRVEQGIKIYNECKEYYEYFTNRYNKLLQFYQRKTVKNESLFFMRRIFQEWKYQYYGAKKISTALENVFRRKCLQDPCHRLIRDYKDHQNRNKSRLIIADLLEKKGHKLITDSLFLWRKWVEQDKIEEIKERLDNLDQYEEDMKEEIKQRAKLIAKELERVGLKQLRSRTFMVFKNIWLTKKTNVRKIAPILHNHNMYLMKTAMTVWKWDRYVNRVDRDYASVKIAKKNLESQRVVFNALKKYRQSIYTIASRIKAINNVKLTTLMTCAFHKILNQAADERDQCHYERKKLMHKIVSAKVARLHIIKRKILWKWHANLIECKHYFHPLLKRLELKTLKTAFALINEKKYWNDCYIKDVADVVTNDGYNQINNTTNALMREGYDPDQIKDYLKNRNEKDLKILEYVIKHFKAWAKKEKAVRAFHSWKQYVQLKGNIKKALTKVFNIAGGMGKYWSRWRAKDPHFNQILKKESRGNMLKRYLELSRLLKEYHRDIRDNGANLEELAEINSEYRSRNKMGVLMALNASSASVKKGMRQGFMLWRDHVYKQRKQAINERFEQMAQGLDMMTDQRGSVSYRIGVLKEENKQLKEKCMWGVECGKILEKLLTEKDTLSIDLADKEHNLKLLLQDNLRLKQKIKLAQNNASKLIRKINEQEGVSSSQ